MFSHFIEIIRTPLLGEVPSASHYLVVVGVTVMGSAVAVLVHRHMRRKLVFFCLRH